MNEKSVWLKKINIVNEKSGIGNYNKMTIMPLIYKISRYVSI